MEKLFLSASSVLYSTTDKGTPVLIVSVTDSNGAGVIGLKKDSFSVRRVVLNGSYNLELISINFFKEDIYPSFKGDNTTDGIYQMKLYPAEVPSPESDIPVSTILTIRVQKFGIIITALKAKTFKKSIEVLAQGWTTTIVQDHPARF